jgi:hypothetical protein
MRFLKEGSGDMMSSKKAPLEVSEASEAFFAALLAAQSSQCECPTCKILRKLAQGILSKYI